VQPQALSESEENDYTKNDTKPDEITPVDANLTAVIEARATLPDAIRTAILSLVRSSRFAATLHDDERES
jgi:hypothetical protein